MNVILGTRPAAEAAKSKALPRTQLLQTVAMAVAAHGMRDLGGIDRIEDLHFKDVAELSTANSVFAVIAEELQICGVQTDGTVGGVMEALGFPRSTKVAADYAHEIGCHCHGDFISPAMASQRILNLIEVAE